MAVIIDNNEISVFTDATNLFEFAARDFSQRAIQAVNAKGFFSVVLSGGSTPKAFFDTLTRNSDYISNIPWKNIQFFFGDERYVPAEDAQSNYHMTNEHLFSKLPVNPENIYRIPTEFTNPKDAAIAYETTLRKVFHIDENAFPLFDLVYLGLGDNAHTASLMPFTDEVKECIVNTHSHSLTASTYLTEGKMYRITLTPPAINNGKEIIFLVTGENKAAAVSEVLEGKYDPLQYPAQLIHNIHKKTLWYLDQAAAMNLTNVPS
jgi:6-phosphogluconolactonase